MLIHLPSSSNVHKQSANIVDVKSQQHIHMQCILQAPTHTHVTICMNIQTAGSANVHYQSPCILNI